jgi:hypothetical protein
LLVPLTYVQFINNVRREEDAEPVDAAPVSDGVNSCTEVLAYYTMEIRRGSVLAEMYSIGRRIVFVDTPGFDGTRLSDTEILRRIAVWVTFS